MNIILTSAEVYPYAKVGGLGDVSGYLPKEWEQLEHNPIVIMPKYGMIDTEKYKIQPLDITISVPMGSWTEYAKLWRGILPGTTVPVYFLESAEYFDRQGIYGNPEGFADNDRRFIFLSRAVFETAKAIDFRADIICANDYHTAFTMAFLKTHYRHDPYFSKTAGVYNIHNIIFQGICKPKETLFIAQIDQSQFYQGSWFEHNGAVNSMKVGIMFADKITTVSPRYATEIRYTDQGYGMQQILNLRGSDVIGILNGVDYNEWNPETDFRIYENYSLKSPLKKKNNKIEYLKEFGIPEVEAYSDMPLIGMVSRLTDQKGFDLVEQILEKWMEHYPIRFTIVGSGISRYENFFRSLAKKHPTRAIVHIGYNEVLSHKIEASSDIFLMPSHFEPCGLNQMYSLKYGTIPLVRATGGLADTVQEFNYRTGEGNGFTFDDYAIGDMAWAMERTISAYFNKPVWQKIMRNAMECNYSSTRSASRYIDVFEWALETIR